MRKYIRIYFMHIINKLVVSFNLCIMSSASDAKKSFILNFDEEKNAISQF